MAVGAAAVVVHTQGRAATEEKQEDMALVKGSWEAEAAKRFLFLITITRR